MEEDGLPKNNEVVLCLYMYTCHTYLCMHAFKKYFPVGDLESDNAYYFISQ